MSDEIADIKTTAAHLKGKLVIRYIELKNYVEYNPTWSPDVVFKLAEAYMDAKAALKKLEETSDHLDRLEPEIAVPPKPPADAHMNQHHTLKLA